MSKQSVGVLVQTEPRFADVGRCTISYVARDTLRRERHLIDLQTSVSGGLVWSDSLMGE